MPDIIMARSSSEPTTAVEGITDAGVEFVDAYTGPLLHVIDSGHIIIPREAEGDLVAAARKRELTHE